MPRLSARDRAIRRMQAAAAADPGPEFELYQRFLQCSELHEPSDILARACATLDVRSHVGAFTASTHTPLPALPGWLPPPI